MHKKILRFDNSYLLIFIYVFSILLFISFNFFSFSELFQLNANLLLICFIQIITFLVFKFDIISCITFLTSFTLLPSLLYKYNPSSGYGDLAQNIVPIFLYKYTFYVFIFLITLSFISYIYKINKLERIVINKPLLKPDALTMTINNAISIIFSFVAFPTIPHFQEVSFTHMLLPGDAWNQLAVVALLFNLYFLLRWNKFTILTYFVVFIWFISHGERADMAGLILGIIIYTLLNNNIKRIHKIYAIFIGIVITILFISIKSDLNISQSIRQIRNFTTVSDMSYSFNACISYVENFGHTYGRIFINIIKSIIPLVHGSYSVESIIDKVYQYPGGALIISAPFLDFGSLGIIIFVILFASIFKLLVQNYNFTLFRYESLILLCSIPRISWYGINYVFTSVLFFVPFMYLINVILNYKENY